MLNFRKVISVVLTLMAGFCFAVSAHAIPYKVTIDTPGLTGTAAQLALDFIDGGPPSNSVVISSFGTDGSLGTTLSIGDISGALPGQVTLGDAFFFNEHLADITLGAQLSFVFSHTVNGPDSGSVPDAFSIFLLDPFSGLPLFGTTDPTGADALLLFEIDGSQGGTLSPFTALGGEMTLSVIPGMQPVPEPSTLLLVFGGMAALVVYRGGRKSV